MAHLSMFSLHSPEGPRRVVNDQVVHSELLVVVSQIVVVAAVAEFAAVAAAAAAAEGGNAPAGGFAVVEATLSSVDDPYH